MSRVAIDDGLLASDGWMAGKQLDRGQDGRERVAEFVSEHGQELVFAVRVFEHARGLERRSDEIRCAPYSAVARRAECRRNERERGEAVSDLPALIDEER
jgi:hypothetical protein